MKKVLLTYLLLFSSLIFAQEKIFTTEEISIDPMLNGTLYIPKKQSPTTSLIILIPGSGIPDRNGNQPNSKTNALQYLAEGLAAKNCAVFSYDKRALALLKAGKIDEKQMNFDDGIADAKEIFNYFKSKDQFHKIIFAGHSEGSLLGMIASKDAADGFISLAGAGRTIDEVIEEQITKQAPSLKQEVRNYLNLLKKGTPFTLENKMLQSLFRESVQPYLISWIKYNPQVEIKKLHVPVLIIAGTKDIQVPVTDALLLNKAYPNSQLEIITNMNHIFKEINKEEENLKSYNNPELPVMPELIEKIAEFTKKL